MRRIIEKDRSIIMCKEHYENPAIGKIIHAVDIVFPPDVDIIITRGCEKVPNGKDSSRHLFPICSALDIRTKHLPKEINREAMAVKVQRGLGPLYYVYAGLIIPEEGNHIEWLHTQHNGEW